MDILVIGGTRFVGHFLVWRLLAAGHKVTILHRGQTPDAFGDRVERLLGDRTTGDLARLLAGRHFDGCVDFAAYRPADVQGVIDALGKRVGHYVFISTGQVYLVREGCPRPAREEDYAGPVMARPDAPREREEWEYGVDKRSCEDLLQLAGVRSGFPATTLRIPMVNGERDYYRRLEGYLWRLLDGGPLLLPAGPEPLCRHVYGRDVARAITQLLGFPRTFGRAYNLCNAEVVPLRELLSRLAEIAGAPARFAVISPQALEEKGLVLKEVSPFSQRWMSFLDPARASAELGFVTTPLTTQLECVVASLLAHPPATRPTGYEKRALEVALATSAGAPVRPL